MGFKHYDKIGSLIFIILSITIYLLQGGMTFTDEKMNLQRCFIIVCLKVNKITNRTNFSICIRKRACEE